MYHIVLRVHIYDIISKMNKKAAGTERKKITASVRAKSSTKATKSTNMDLNGSFLTPSGGTIVSTSHFNGRLFSSFIYCGLH